VLLENEDGKIDEDNEEAENGTENGKKSTKAKLQEKG
jgi:hypothetical protein